MKKNTKKGVKKETTQLSSQKNDEEEVVQHEEEENKASSLQTLQDDLTEAKDKYIRLYAEFENHRRRTAQEKIDLTQSANEQLITALLPVMDDFERAEKSGNENIDKTIEGFQLIQSKLQKALERFEVKAVDVDKGADFNPDFHETVTKIQVPEENLKGKVVDVLEKGYTLHDRVIRYAKIVIGD